MVGYPRFLAAVVLFAGARLLPLRFAAGRFDAALFVATWRAEDFRAEAVFFAGVAFRPVVDDLDCAELVDFFAAFLFDSIASSSFRRFARTAFSEGKLFDSALGLQLPCV